MFPRSKALEAVHAHPHVEALVRPQRRAFVASYVFQIIAGVAPLVQVLILRDVIDHLTSDAAGPALWWQVLAMLGLGLVGVWAGFAARVLTAGAASSAVAAMQSAMFDRLTTMPMLFYTTVRPGAVVARLTSDVTGAEGMYTSVVPVIVSSITTLLTSVVIVAFVDPRLLMLLVIIPLAVWYVRKAEARINDLIAKSFDVTKEMSASIETAVSRDGAALVRQSGRTEIEQRSFRRLVDTLAGYSRSTVTAGATAAASYGTAFVVISAGALGIGLYLVQDRGVSVGSLVLVVLYLQQLQGPVQTLLGTRYPRVRATIALGRVESVLAAEPGADAAAGQAAVSSAARTSRQGEYALELRSVDYRYPRVDSYSIDGLSHAGEALTISWMPITGLSRASANARERPGGAALTGIDLAVRRGEVVAVVGPSGAGKSTLAMIASGLLEPDHGSVLVGGRPLSAMDEQAVSSSVAYIPQDTYVLHATIRENLVYAAPHATDEEIQAACSTAQLDGLIGRLEDGLDTTIGEKGHRLSGGERQRLAIARAVLKRPTVVVLDEPTAHLDTATEASVRAAMNGAFGTAGVLMIAHRLSTVRTADTIAVVENGRIAESGTHEVLSRTGGRYAALLAAEAPNR